VLTFSVVVRVIVPDTETWVLYDRVIFKESLERHAALIKKVLSIDCIRSASGWDPTETELKRVHGVVVHT